jgi:hypothetical protein
MSITSEKELNFLALFIKWQNDSPEDRHKIQSFLSDKNNTQTTRLAFILNLVAYMARNDDFNNIFQQLAKYTARRKDNNYYLSKDSSWMREPYHVKGGWYFEGCTNFNQKKNCIQHLPKIRFSSSFRFSTQFSDCAGDFIANKNLDKYQPTESQSDNLNYYQEKLKKFDSVSFDTLLSILVQ